VALLVAVSIAGFIVPKALTGRLIGLAQVLAPFQQATNSLTHSAGDALSFSSSKGVSTEQFEELQRENESLRHTLVAMAARSSALEREREALAGIRQRGLQGGKLIAAKVVAGDALSWRASRLLNAGSLSGVRGEAAVTSDYFTIATSEDAPARDGEAVLAGEVLVGFISQVSAYSARAVLLTDAQTHLRVCVARIEGQQCLPLDADFWLVGTGKEMLEVRDVDHRYIKNGAIQKGDIVFSHRSDLRLPVSLTVGTVSAVRQDPDNTLLYVLDVAPPLKSSELRDVFVVDRGSNR
jgi:cell shape-determining protein MreC